MAPKGNKRKRENASDVEPVAKRTRLSTGAPMRRAIPVQYPHKWLMHKGKCEESIATVKDPSNILGAKDCNQYSKVNSGLPSTSKAASVGGHRLPSSCPHKQRRKAYNRSARSRRVAVSRGRSRRRRKAGMSYRPRRSAHPRAQQRRRNIVRILEKKKRLGPRKVDKLRARKYKHKMHVVKKPPPLGHENDSLFNKKNQKISGKREDLKDQVVDDPLNVRKICRKLVRHVQGRPADSRDSKPGDAKADQKSGKPSEEQAKRDNVSSRQHTKPEQATRKLCPFHALRHGNKKTSNRPEQRMRRLLDGVIKRGVTHKHRRSGARLVHRSTTIWCNSKKRCSRLQEVQRKQKANRSATVARRRRNRKHNKKGNH